MSEKYVSMWVEENANCEDAEPILIAFSEGSKKVWGQGIDQGMVFIENTTAEFFLPQSEIDKESGEWYTFFMEDNSLESYLSRSEKAISTMNSMISKLLDTDLPKLDDGSLSKIFLELLSE